ncbi:hypothetical protein CXF92_02855 [Pseudomonas sp. Choline-3u-10]|nr:hypothetical protein [Pseudomonas sp.]PKG95801.1 hypothetical protein CXF92_02855 [Pseudomonas sp. Choline-3u-10]HBM07110.1 hypothetical protein [Pseudomonas sp.]
MGVAAGRDWMRTSGHGTQGRIIPHSGNAPGARREGPSMANHGSRGIHAGQPLTRHLRSAF